MPSPGAAFSAPSGVPDAIALEAGQRVSRRGRTKCGSIVGSQKADIGDDGAVAVDMAHGFREAAADDDVIIAIRLSDGRKCVFCIRTDDCWDPIGLSKNEKFFAL